MTITSHHRFAEILPDAPRSWLVTGAAGFIGSNLVEELLSLGQVVIGLDNFSTGRRANITEAVGGDPDRARRFNMIEGDIRDLELCRAACEGIDFVLHHAALGSVPWSVADPLTTNAVNVTGFVNMLVAAKDAGVARVVYASSSAVYGDDERQPQREEHIGRPLSPYASSKAANETYALAFQRSYGFESIGLRYFNVFGRRQDPSGAYAAVIPRWITNLLRGETCTIFGDGETTRDFCHVANVVQANILAATADIRSTGAVYNIACGESITLNQLFEMLREQLAYAEPDIAFASPRREEFRTGDVRYSCASIEKARKLLDYAPSHGVDDGLAEAREWYVRQSRAQPALSFAPYR